MKHLNSQPGLIDFGITYKGAVLGGSFQIIGARKFKSMKCFSEFRREKTVVSDSPPKWLKLIDEGWTWQEGLAYSFQVDTSSIGFRGTSMTLKFDTGTSHVSIRADVRSGKPGLGDLVICNEPFYYFADLASGLALTRFMKGLDFRTHHLAEIPRRFGRQPRTILLYGSGLIHSVKNNLSALTRTLEAGTNLIVLAGASFGGTVDAANMIGDRYGMTFATGREPGYASMDEMVASNESYSDAAQIRRHPLTKGVERLHWFRPWPVECASKKVTQLAHDSNDPRKCYAAVAKPKGYLVMVGQSFWTSMAGVGWPFNNDRFMANLLVGGDAGN
ncbi:MAG TPA: hypothetical protein VIM11_27900 [Tepidisphaeraceae bacterium]|jgi:hypothetical protein